MELDILKVIAIALIGIVTIGVVKNLKPEFAIYLVLATILVMLFLIVGKLSVVLEFLGTIYGQISYGKTFFPILMKVLAIAYLTDFTAQLCSDAGEGAIASKVELAGKIIIFYLSIPILVAILELINSVL